jgi:hypothetical protein
MDITLAHRFAAEAIHLDGHKIADYPLCEVDFEPAVQWAYLEGVRRGRLAPRSMPPPAHIEPVSCDERGAPYISGFAVRFPGHRWQTQFDESTFRESVITDSQALVAQGLLQAGEQFNYRVCAFAADVIDEQTVNTAEADFTLDPADEIRPLRTAELPTQRSRHGSHWDPADLPVVFAPHVIEEAVRLSSAAGELETGGMLLGNLRRGTADLFLEVTEIMTAPEAIATRTTLHFGPDTFAAVERLLALRKREEVIVGWWHRHPPELCSSACPPERRAVCVYNEPFFSQADCDVHRTLFPQAHSQALLVSEFTERPPSVDLFAWRRGVVQARGYFVADQTTNRTNPARTVRTATDLSIRQSDKEHTR